MRQFLALLALIGAAASLAINKPNDGQPLPPQSNPNVATEHQEGHQKPVFAPVPAFDNVDIFDVSSDAQCDVNAIAAASGDQLVNLVKNAPRRCVLFTFNAVGRQAKDTCNEADMVTVAGSFYGAAYNYDAANPKSSPGILNLVQYLRGCLYNQGYNKADIGEYSNNVGTQVKYGLDVFFGRPNLQALNTDHYEIFQETITLVSNAHESLNYAGKLAQLLTLLSDWKFESSVFIQNGYQENVINAIYDNIFRSHYEKDKAIPYYKSHPEVAKAINDFMNKQARLLNTKNEWILRNTGGELARFLQYTDNYATYSGYVKSQLQKYTPTNGEKVWASIVTQIDYYDKKNCQTYNICNFKADLEKKILPFTKNCGKTYVDTFIVRAQQISDAEANTVCQRLKDQESYYHNLVKDNWQPVNPDVNDKIEVVIFNDVDEYKIWANLLFGISTDNGGMYIEGDPTKPGNVARYFCYERPRDGKFDVWNLEHEFTHYLDGRYDMLGDFTASSKGRTIWWIEGFAEYAANKNQYPSMVQDCKDKSYPLSTIFSNDYNAGQDRIYHYGYLAARFMFERHRSDVDTIVGYFRKGNYSAYESFLSGILNRYDQEFSSWCTCIANGKPC